MRRLQMGMWHEFNKEAWNSQHLGLITGLEVSSYRDEGSLGVVRAFCEKHGFAYGIHSPVLGKNGYHLPKVNAVSATERMEAFQNIEEEVSLASRYAADYVLYHYPFLPIYSHPIRMPLEKLPAPGERYEYSDISEKQFREFSIQLFDHLCILQQRYQQRILLEHDFFGNYSEIFIGMFKQYPDIKLVVDTARLDITSIAFFAFNPYEWLDKLAPHVYLVHYSNVRYEENSFVHHLPVQQEHDDDPRYGDSYAYLTFLADRNKQFHLTFEHKADMISREQLYNVYQRVADLLRIAPA